MATLLKCQGPDCATSFEGRAGTKFCSATCRSRARRGREASAQSVAADARAVKAEHELATVTRSELEKAGALKTVLGQVALQLARKLVNPDETGVSALSKQLLEVVDRAKAAAAGAGAGDSAGSAAAATPPEDDEVKKARRKREEIEARAAAEAAEAQA